VDEIKWGPTGEIVYNRTYSRTKADGSKETWPETVERVVDGNLALVPARFQIPNERDQLIELMTQFKILPAGRHLWASGVKGAQHLFNCWVAGWTDTPSEHFAFTFLRLMEGGGVGANYTNAYLSHYPLVQHFLEVHIVCDREHPDYAALVEAGVLSARYDADWGGAYVVDDSREGWARALTDLIDTHYREETTHFNRVYDVSNVRHAGAKLKTFGGTASGPLSMAQMLIQVSEIFSRIALDNEYLDGLSAMEVDHAIAQCVVAGGVRRSARMAMMHWADPQIEKFIHIKQDSGSHWTTNISVMVDEDFWYQQRQGTSWHASKIMRELSEGAVRNGEPGMWDWSASNKGEPNEVICTNPCGEITLQAWEPCNLGHVNLAGFVDDKGRVDILGLFQAHRLMTRFLIRATFSEVGDPKSREVLDRNRRIGVGHFGVASFLALRGERYSEAPLNQEFKELLKSLAIAVDSSAVDFSHDLRIPVPVKSRTVAPTGTIAKMPGVSEGIHPIFSKYFIRRVRFNKLSDAETLERLVSEGHPVEDDLFAPNTSVVSFTTKDSLVAAVADIYGDEFADDIVESASDLTLHQMLAFQAMYQQCWADNAVSFTANVDPSRYSATSVGGVLKTFAGQIKGSTIFPEASYPQAPYERISKGEFEAAALKEVADGVDESCANGACPIK
jgi:ribonucleoside-triphosphate reductase